MKRTLLFLMLVLFLAGCQPKETPPVSNSPQDDQGNLDEAIQVVEELQNLEQSS